MIIDKSNLLQGWHVMRIARLLIGIFLIVTSFIQRDIFYGLFGGVFAFQALSNTGCCASACSPATSNKVSQQKVEETEYEEIK